AVATHSLRVARADPQESPAVRRLDANGPPSRARIEDNASLPSVRGGRARLARNDGAAAPTQRLVIRLGGHGTHPRHRRRRRADTVVSAPPLDVHLPSARILRRRRAPPRGERRLRIGVCPTGAPPRRVDRAQPKTSGGGPRKRPRGSGARASPLLR